MSESAYWFWGLMGALLVRGVDTIKLLRESNFQIPDEFRLPGWWLAQAVFLGLGAGAAFALGELGQLAGGFGAFTAGAAAPAVIENLGLPEPSPTTPEGSKPPGSQPPADSGGET